jgi:hypothetical protein
MSTDITDPIIVSSTNDTSQNDIECGVCYELFESKQIPVLDCKCTSKVCATCLESHFKQECPFCRTPHNYPVKGTYPQANIQHGWFGGFGGGFNSGFSGDIGSVSNSHYGFMGVDTGSIDESESYIRFPRFRFNPSPMDYNDNILSALGNVLEAIRLLFPPPGLTSFTHFTPISRPLNHNFGSMTQMTGRMFRIGRFWPESENDNVEVMNEPCTLSEIIEKNTEEKKEIKNDRKQLNKTRRIQNKQQIEQQKQSKHYMKSMQKNQKRHSVNVRFRR